MSGTDFAMVTPALGSRKAGSLVGASLPPWKRGVFSERNLSKWPLGRRFTVFSPKKRLHISSIQDTIIKVRVGFFSVPKKSGKPHCQLVGDR